MKEEKDIPSSGRITGFEVRMWYRRQPRVCPIYNGPGHHHRQMPTQLGACAGDVAMLAMTVAKPGAADQFRCQRRVFLKVILRVTMLVPPPAIHLGSSRLPRISVPMVRRCYPGMRRSLLGQLRRPLDLRSPRVRIDPEREQSASSRPPSKSRPFVGDEPVPMALSSKRRVVMLQAFMGGYPFHETYQSGCSTLP